MNSTHMTRGLVAVVVGIALLGRTAACHAQVPQRMVYPKIAYPVYPQMQPRVNPAIVQAQMQQAMAARVGKSVAPLNQAKVTAARGAGLQAMHDIQNTANQVVAQVAQQQLGQLYRPFPGLLRPNPGFNVPIFGGDADYQALMALMQEFNGLFRKK